jgi:hypothetical protein
LSQSFVPIFQDYNKILTIVSSEGEIVHLERPVRAEGSVEVPNPIRPSLSVTDAAAKIS